MGVHLLDASSVLSFVNNGEKVHQTISTYFQDMDSNHQGRLTQSQFQPFVESLNVMDMDLDFGVPLQMTPQQVADRCSSIFKVFDTNGDGFVDEEEFEFQLKEVFRAIAQGLGQTSVHIVVNDSSILKEVVTNSNL